MDLQDKTIFDFTNDEKIIVKIVGNTPKDYYLRYGHPLNKLADIVDCAYLTHNDELYETATEALNKAQKEWDVTIENAGQDGVIID